MTSEMTIGLALPNGPEMGVAVLATMAYAACAPLNVDLTPEELLHDMQVRCCRQTARTDGLQRSQLQVAQTPDETMGSFGKWVIAPGSPGKIPIQGMHLLMRELFHGKRQERLS